MTQDKGPDKTKALKWYFRTPALITAFLVVGPFCLPLVWCNPDFSKKKKLIITLIIVLLSGLLVMSVTNSLRTIKEYYKLAL